MPVGGLVDRKLEGGICAVAQALVREYLANAAIPSRNVRVVPSHLTTQMRTSDTILFDTAGSGLWDLPLLAHIVGELAVPPDFATAQAKETLLPPSYVEVIFGDAFAVYCQGPAFVYACLTSHFSPIGAEFGSELRPSTDDRLKLMLRMLQLISDMYELTIEHIKRDWSEAAGEADLDTVKLNIKRTSRPELLSLADRIYERLETRYNQTARFEPYSWLNAEGTSWTGVIDCSKESLRTLASRAWNLRLNSPDEIEHIAIAFERGLEQRCSV